MICSADCNAMKRRSNGVGEELQNAAEKHFHIAQKGASRRMASKGSL